MTDLPHAERGIGEILAFLQTKRQELDDLDAELQAAHTLAGETEERWTQFYDEIIDTLWKTTSGKMPGEDIRVSLARSRGGAEAWTNHRRAERMVKKLEGRARMLADQIRSAQSEAKLMGTY
jgi:hypothetical protein